VDVPVLGFRNLEVQRNIVGTLMGHGDPSRKAGINDLPMVFDWRSGGDVRLNISEKRASPLHSRQAPAVMTREEASEDLPVPTADKTGTLDTGGAGSPKAHGGAWPGYKAQDSDKGFLVLTKEQVAEEMLRRIKHCVTCPDSPRYRALGNAVTVQVAEWIGRRVLKCHLGTPGGS